MPRTDRLDSLFRKEISSIIQFELTNSEIGFATVSEVKIAPDLSVAKVYVSFLGPKKDSSIEALKRCKGYIKRELAHRISIRKIPDLEFIIDDSLERAQHIEDIINKNKKAI